jgi:hypothetical protein
MTNDDDTNTNIVVFAPQRRIRIERAADGKLVPVVEPPEEPPPVAYVELRLGDDCGIEMMLYDGERNVVAVLGYVLAAQPQDFDLRLLREAWLCWRDTSSAVAS